MSSLQRFKNSDVVQTGLQQKIQLLSSTNVRKSRNIYTDDRFTVESSESSSILRVINVTWEDAGTYYCGVMNEYDVSFAPPTEVVVEDKDKPPDSLLQTVIQSPDCISVQPGDSVTLKCSFNTSNCPQDQTSVIWKNKNATSESISWSNRTKPIYCESGGNIGEASCVHNLTLTWKDVSSDEDQTYFCAVTAYECPNAVALIGSSLVVGLVISVLLWGIWRTSIKTELDSCVGRSSHNNKNDDTLTRAEGSLVTSYRLMTLKRRRDPEVYSQVWYCHCE
ncbi:hypothetical protein WMY93_017261 [Mugilogobius chulae]|uniref:Ig-like domain-containing protein n=1 Tax=Mugilogobius chulae TaxID=88201 RepID=A0AAW0NZW3_9GOBI